MVKYAILSNGCSFILNSNKEPKLFDTLDDARTFKDENYEGGEWNIIIIEPGKNQAGLLVNRFSKLITNHT